MAATNINRVVMTGNLTADPELRSLPSGMSVCSLRIACNTRRKNGSTGEWEDKPNYFNVTVWGAQGENAAQYLSKGRPVAIDGRLEWREWESPGRDKAPGNRYHCRLGAVPGLARGGLRWGGFAAGNGASRGQRRPRRRSGISSPHLSPAERATTTFRSSQQARSCVSNVSHARATALRRSTLMAKARGRGKPVRRRDKKGGPGSGRRKPCQHCRDKVEQVDYKDVASLRSSSPRRARSARGGSPAPAGAIRSRSPAPSSALASWRCCRT